MAAGELIPGAGIGIPEHFFFNYMGMTVLFILFVVGIVLSHRIVGPSYRLKQLFWKVSRGDLAITEKLRGGDELVDLFDAFTSMVAALRAQHASDLTSLEGALRALAKDHPDDPGVAALRASIERLRQRRGAQDDTARLSRDGLGP